MSEGEQIPLFPLKSVLFPRGRIPLQIFEKRYIDLVSRSLREDQPFGICLIMEGEEVLKPGSSQKVHRTGTCARIVDWRSLPNGLLGITIEGIRKFRVIECGAQEDNLLVARIEHTVTDFIGEEPLPIDERDNPLATLLRQLMDHPAIERLALEVDFGDLREVGWRLSELLPIPVERKQQLLEMNDALLRARALEELVEKMIDQDGADQ